MSRTVLVNVLTQDDQVQTSAPSGGMVISLLNSAGALAAPAITVTETPWSASFVNIPPDTYTATAQNINNAGSPVGMLATSAAYLVVDLPVTFPYAVPVSITVAAQ